MKKLYILLIAIFLLPVLSIAQNRLETSESFEEPVGGWNKVLQLSNGNTFFFQFHKDKGIEVWVYNERRQKISTLIVKGTQWETKKLPESAVEGLYEIGGQPVIFLQQVINRTPSLFRIILNAQTGAVESEEIICTLPKYKTGSGWAMAYGGVKAMDFYVEKDPKSDNYAVVNFNTFSSESGERIEVVQFSGANGKHITENKAFYEVPISNMKYIDFIAMTVDKKSVYLCSYGYPDKWSSKEARLVISKLSTNDKQFNHRLLEFSQDFRSTQGLMLYNPGTNMLQLLTLTEVSSKNNILTGSSTTRLMTLMTYIDPQTLSIISSKPIVGQMISEHLSRLKGKESTYFGLPQLMVLNKDNSTTVLMEEMTKIVRTNSTGQIVSANTNLGPIGIAQLNERGGEEDGHVIQKLQVAAGLFNPMYVAKKSKGLWSYRASGFKGMHNNAFLSFDYISTEKGNYVLFNDHPEHVFNQHVTKKRKPVTQISGTSTVCYKMKHGQPEATFLFGSPNKNNSNFCYVEASHFLPSNNTYATLLIQREGRSKKAVIAWVRFE